MIKVLNVTITPLWTDGISNSLVNYFENIDCNKIKIGFACPNVFEGLEKRIKNGNGNIHIIKSKRSNIFSYINELRKIIKENKYDIVHVHGSSSILSIELIAATLAGCKHKIVHSRNTKTDHPKIDKMLRPIFNLLHNEKFACGRDAGKWLFGENSEFTIIPNGKKFENFKFNYDNRIELRERYKIKDDEILLGHIGNFNYQKNHEYLIEIFNELCKTDKNYKLILVGIGGQQQLIKEKIKEYNLEEKVIFLGQIPIEEVSKLLSAMDIMLFPSRFEGFPNVLIEWQMAGVQSIISNKITEDVKITNLVQFANIDEKPEEWVKIIKDTNLYDRSKNVNQLYEQITKAGFNIIENGKMLEDKYIEIYEKK